jgi:hypothetical protein
MEALPLNRAVHVYLRYVDPYLIEKLTNPAF